MCVCVRCVCVCLCCDQAAQQASFEAWKAEEARQLANRRRVLDQQYKVGAELTRLAHRLDSAAITAHAAGVVAGQQAVNMITCAGVALLPQAVLADTCLGRLVMVGIVPEVCMSCPVAHHQAMYKMPTKKDKSALEAIEAALDREKSEAKAAAARHKLTVERLRCQVKQLQVKGVVVCRVPAISRSCPQFSRLMPHSTVLLCAVCAHVKAWP